MLGNDKAITSPTEAQDKSPISNPVSSPDKSFVNSDHTGLKEPSISESDDDEPAEKQTGSSNQNVAMKGQTFVEGLLNNIGAGVNFTPKNSSNE